jgi:fructose 1,6-bisphosphatase
MAKDLAQYMKERGAAPLDPKALEEYVAEMQETVIPKIIEDMRQNLRAVARIRFKPLF